MCGRMRSGLILSRKGAALFTPIFTIMYIIALFNVGTFFLSEKSDALKKAGIGGEAVFVQSQLWHAEAERVAQSSVVREQLCYTFADVLKDLPENVFTVEKIVPVLEAELQKALQSKSKDSLIGITNINPLTVSSIPKNEDVQEFSLTLYSETTQVSILPISGTNPGKKKAMKLSRSTNHAFSVMKEYDLGQWEDAHTALKNQLQRCTIAPSRELQWYCMTDLEKLTPKWVVYTADKKTYTATMTEQQPMSGCSQSHSLTYTVTLPEPEKERSALDTTTRIPANMA